ncbi:MAG: hypothetical protein VKJ02_04870 [Snowella sp.]|nr:hypothetical protein [Snowella sp.]
MKLSTLSFSTVLGILGVIPMGVNSLQAQECAVSPDGSRSITCAKIYSATPGRVQLSGAVGEQTIDTLSQDEVVNTFAVSALSNDANLYPNNVLETVTYARANLEFNDGSLVWLKPDTRVTLTSSNNCQVGILSDQPPVNPNRVGVRPNTNQRLCLLSGSLLVMTPTQSRFDRANLSVLTDEATIWKPASIYLVTRNPKQNRTSIYVFSGNRGARVSSTMDTNTVCGISPNRALSSTSSSQSTCGFRLRAGEYMTVTRDNTSTPKPFDLPAWVAMDPWFAPIIANTTFNVLRSESLTEVAIAAQPSTTLKTIEYIQPSVINSIASLQSAICPIEIVEFAPLGIAQLPNPQFNPIIPPRPVTPQVTPFTPPPTRPVRGLW